MAKRADLEPLIIKEWLTYSGEDKSMQRVQVFYAYLQREKPHLLSFRCTGDKWQVFKSILKKHIIH